MSTINRSFASWVLCSVLTLASAGAAAEGIRVLALFKNRIVVEIDGRQETLKVGQASKSGVVLKRSNSQSAWVEVGGRELELKLGDHIGGTFTPASGAKVQIFPDPQGMYVTEGSINGVPVSFLVDTGATYVVMNHREAERVGIDYAKEGRRGQAETANGVVDSYELQLERVKVGEIQLYDVLGAVVIGETPSKVLLGNSFLGRLRLKREGQVLEFEKLP